MLLFQKRFHAGLTSGEVTVTFRRWEKPRVKVGGRYRCHPIGVLEVDRLDKVAVRDITPKDARLAGFPSKDALLEYLSFGGEAEVTPATELYRVQLHHGGDGDRVPLALEAELSEDDVAEIRERLRRLDADGRWTRKTLSLIAANPQVAASQLAKKVRRETEPFKVDVRKLKKLGLTQSFEVGYELSPRGKAFLARCSRW